MALRLSLDTTFLIDLQGERSRREPDEETALIYAGVVRDLRSQDRLIGTNDLWIGASSLRFRLPVVTADVEHFRRVEGLEVIGYSADDRP